MRSVISTYIDRFRHERRTRIQLLTIVLALAVVVAGIVFWQLHYTGVAAVNEVYCGMEEHTHSEDCYAQVLICGMEESDSDVLLLDAAEDEEAHVHDASCYEEVLTCDIPEHTHTVLCLADETADVETADVWEATLPELTGNQAYDVVAIAQSQVGYAESELNFTLAEDGETRNGYTRYGAWYGNAYGDWDAMFASFVLHYAGVPEEDFPQASGAYAWATELEKQGLLTEDGSTPSRGDLVFLDTDYDAAADTVAIVKAESDGVLTLIQGDADNAVVLYEIAENDPSVVGFGVLPEQEDAPPADFETLDAAAEAIKESQSADAYPDDHGFMPLSEGMGDVLDGDYAYLTSVAMESGDNNGYAMTTGTAPWDGNDDAGNDSGENNAILRTYDTATYTVSLTTQVRDSAPNGTYRTGNLYFEFVVKGSSAEIQWETGSMGWLESKHGVYTLSEETYDNNGIAETYQVLRGYITLEPSTSDGHAIGNTTQSLNIDLRALAMQNKDVLRPQFTFFLAYNDVGLESDQYDAWGTSSYNGPMVTFEGKECSTSEHGEEYHTVTAPEITISAAPRYNLAIVSSTASKTQQMGSYDFSTGNDLALDKVTSGDSAYYGRLGGYGLVLQIVGKDETNGLRGVQLPAEGETLSFSFTLDLSSTYTADGTKYTTGEISNDEDLIAYAPRIWSFDENKTGRNNQQDERVIPTSTNYADQVPYNSLTGNGNSNPANYWYASCNDGGSWSIKENTDGTYTVTVTGCKVDMSQLPYVHPGAGTSLSYRYYNPNNINYDPSDSTKNNYWEVQTACLSAGELWVVQPYYAGAKDDGTTYIAQMLGEGTFSVTLKDTKLEVTQGNTNLMGNTDQAITTDDTQEQAMALVNPGTIDQHIAYVKYNYSAYNDPLTDGCFSSGKDWILQGDILGIETYVTNDSAEEGNTGVAYDVMIKFDDSFFQPDGKIRFSAVLNSETRTYLWAAKPNGSGWDHQGLKPDADGYDSEMINATPDDLVYFSSLNNLEDAGYTCVGVLVQYRGLMTEQQNHIHTYVLGSSKMSAESDQVYMVTPYCRSWDRDDLAAAMAADPGNEYYGNNSAALSALLSMSTTEVNTVVNQYIPTRTADNGADTDFQYEDDSGTAKDYPSAHWVNGDSRHPTTATGGSSRTPTILNYVKCYYDENGCHEGTSGNYWGDSCLLVGFKSGLTMKVAQQTTSESGATQNKSVFDMDTAQTVVDYEVSPFISRNNGEDSSETSTLTNVVVTITLPENLTYIEGSSYIGGTYVTNGEGVQGTVAGGVQLTNGVENSFTYTVTYTEEDDDGSLVEKSTDYTVGVLLTVTEVDGKEVLTYTFIDFPVTGMDVTQYLENIYFSCEISSGAVSNGQQLNVTADIYCSSDQGVDPTMRDNGEAIVGITVTKTTAISLVKTADQTAVEVNEEISYTIDIGDNSQTSMTMVAVDNLPYNGDGYSTFKNEDCEVYVTEFSAYDVTATRDLSGFYFFYTTDEDYAGNTSADYPEGTDFVTGLGTEYPEVVADKEVWTLMSITPTTEDSNGHTVYSYTDFPKDQQVYAIVGVGIIEGNDDINLHVKLKLSDPEPGDVVVNRLSQQHAITTTDSNGNAVVDYEDLSDSARVRVIGRTMSGTVWLDEDVDGGIRTGVYQSEQLLAGVDVELQIKENGNWVTAQKLKTSDDESAYCETKTDEKGYYEFEYLPAGDYRVVFSGTGTGDNSSVQYTLSSHNVTLYEAEGIDAAVNSKVTRSESADCIPDITLPAASAISGSTYDDAYENAGYTLNVPFTVDKVWKDVDGEDVTDQRTTGSVTVQITADENVVRNVVLNMENKWNCKIEDLPYYDGTGKAYDYKVAGFTVVETEGGEGYITTIADIVENDDGSYSVTVTNRVGADGAELPMTGGAGTWMYTMAGLLLMTGAAYLLYRNTRKERGSRKE